MTDVQALLDQALDEAGIPRGLAVYVGEPTPESPDPPNGPWVLVGFEGEIVVGGCSRGEFRTYEVCPDAETAVRLVVRLLTEPGARRPLEYDADESLKRGLWTSQKILGRCEVRGGEVGPAELQRGDLLDAVEPETAHHLYPLGTPWQQRSLPPPDEDTRYRIYEVAEPFLGRFPDALEGEIAPWFEQPGGGAMVVLDRPIRAYVDAGLLVELIAPSPPSA